MQWQGPEVTALASAPGPRKTISSYQFCGALFFFDHLITHSIITFSFSYFLSLNPFLSFFFLFFFFFFSLSLSLSLFLSHYLSIERGGRERDGRVNDREKGERDGERVRGEKPDYIYNRRFLSLSLSFSLSLSLSIPPSLSLSPLSLLSLLCFLITPSLSTVILPVTSQQEFPTTRSV
eukprot:sb/3471803/